MAIIKNDNISICPYSTGSAKEEPFYDDWVAINNEIWLHNNEMESVPAIQGNPKKAGWLVSWAYKKKELVCFCKNKGDMLKLVSNLMKDERVIKESIIIHKISAQYRPKHIRQLRRLWVKELKIVKDKS